MTWNYRVIRKRHAETDSVTYQIHEVYYGEDREIERWTEDPVVVRNSPTRLFMARNGAVARTGYRLFQACNRGSIQRWGDETKRRT